MITALIIDDEQHCIDRLMVLLHQYCKYSVTVIDSFKNIKTGIAGIEKHQPGLIFLDVEIGSETGFELLQKLKQINFDVIFTTAHNQYAVKAFKFSAMDYLLKPIDPDDLQLAVEKVKNKLLSNNAAKNFETLFHNLKGTNSQTKKISVATITGFEILNVSDIIRCQSDVNYTTLFLTDKKTLMVAKTLKEFDELLCDYNFFRVHNSHLINLTFVKSYHKGKGGYVSLTDGKEIEVSTRRKDDFLKALASL